MSQALSTTTLNLNLLGDWQPPADRRDPIAVLEQQEIDRLPWLVPVRHSRMAQNAFAFYRGTPAVMAHDLGHAPSSGLEVQLCGDCHLANFGFYGSPEWHLLFDINDFDETVRGPFEWDLKRLVASAVLAARALKLPAEQQRRAARRTARSYRHAMCALAAQPLQQIWAQRIDMEAFVAEVGHEPLRRHLEKVSAKAKARTNSEAAGKLCEFGPDGALQLRHDPPLIWRHALLDRHWTADMHWRELVDEMLLKYMASLPAELQHLMHHFRLADAALKAVGIGSVGTRCAIGLFVGHHPDEVLILQSKQAETSVLGPYASSPPPPHHGQRVVEGQRLMQTASDPFLGWSTGANGRQHYWRQLRNWKGAVELGALDAKGLELYGELCGKVLAKAHARSGDARAIAHVAGEGKVFDRAMENYALAYADQSERDYRIFLQAIQEGRLQTGLIF
ncbi:MAG: DUF2252 domain-containing protein [Cyanobacteria bacterium K_DeepCast_35m_m2_155]|nr:DUF2252 domain-containing protein [Cyanobacteria bacterium K_DeepCast_35m_m2_155]